MVVKNKSIKNFFFIAGLGIVLLSFLPYLILGVDAIVPYHDQLDGELVAYIMQAKYLFSGSDMIPEFLGGALKTSLMPPAPFAVLLFTFMSPFTAYLILQLVGQVTAYIGMYLLGREVTEKKWIAAGVAVLFAFLPFLPVYGLTQYGLPMLFVSALWLFRNERTLVSLIYVAFYGAMSSLVLGGFGVLFFWLLAMLLLVATKKYEGRKYFLAGFVLLLAIYLVENFSLITQILGITGDEISHKAEYAVSGSNFFMLLWDCFLYNVEHCEDYHTGILALLAVTLLFLLLKHKKLSDAEKKKCVNMLLTLGGIVVCCVLSALWGSTFVAAIRAKIGSLGAFQVSRFMWLVPCLWYLLLAYCLDVWFSAGKKVVWLAGIVLTGFIGCLAFSILKGSHVKPCIQKVLNPSYKMISWSDYLAYGVMERVESYIRNETGMEQSEYKVVSLGIDPSAALYHGFYCLDGYSNNYSLEYKHQFRKIIAPELERNEYLQGYFDDWGNRCYLFSSEIPGYFNIEKGSFWYNDLQLNTEALREMECRYVLSAAYVVNSEELGWVLLEETPFETADSYYRIYLYEISE